MNKFFESSKFLFLDSIYFGIILTDIHSNILFANRYSEIIFGYERKEIEGQRMRILFLEEDLIYLLPNIIYLTLYKNGFEGELLLKRKDGSKIFVNLHTSSFKEDGETFLIFSLQEIQRLKMIEKEKIKMNHWANAGMLLEEIAHQIRNPIVSIGGYTKRLMKSLDYPSKDRVYLDKIIHEVDRLEKTLSRIEELVLIPMPIIRKEVVKDVFDEVIKRILKKAEELGIAINLETGSLNDNEYFFIDRNLIVKALLYIIENSFDAIISLSTNKKRAVISLSVFKEYEYIKILVSDKGEGIPKKIIRRIFEPFFSTRHGRVGLGLTFVKRVIEEHKGMINVSSESGKGTTVILKIPIDRRRLIRRELISCS